MEAAIFFWPPLPEEGKVILRPLLSAGKYASIRMVMKIMEATHIKSEVSPDMVCISRQRSYTVNIL